MTMDSKQTEINAEVIQADAKIVPPRFIASHRNALFISGIALAGLMGIVLGMFMASDRNAPRVMKPAVSARTSEWLDQPVTDTAEMGTDNENGENANAQMVDPDVVENQIVAQPGSQPVADTTPQRTTLKSGQAVVTALADLGLTAGDAQLIINALDGVFDFRRARPGHLLEVQFDEISGRPSTFRYEASRTDIYVVKLEGETYKGRKLNIVPDKSMKVFAGTITSSLFGTLKDLGAHAALAGKVADILSTQVNFLKEQRPGDTFRVMVEEESLDGEYLGYGPVLALEYNGVKAGQRRLFFFQEGNERATYYDESLVSTPRSALTLPLYYSRVSSQFGWRMHPVLKRRKLHNGVDFSASPGTPVWACADGQIIFAGMKGANGNLVGIQHDNGLTSYYAHLRQIEKGIRNGVTVRRRQVIGYVGNTGRSTGPHLHWGVKLNGTFIDPLKYKIIPGKKVSGAYAAKLKAVMAERKHVLNSTPIEPPKGELEQVPDNDYPLGMDDL
jgi:hypothetical protein